MSRTDDAVGGADAANPDATATAPPAFLAGVGETLGAALAREFARERPVALLARSTGVGAGAGPGGRGGARDAIAIPGDVTDRENVAAAANEVRERFGPPGVVVHNASAPGGGRVDDCSADDFEATWAVRAKGGFHLASEFADDLRETEGALLFAGTNYATEPSGTLVDWDSAAAATRGHSLATSNPTASTSRTSPSPAPSSRPTRSAAVGATTPPSSTVGCPLAGSPGRSATSPTRSAARGRAS
jgi:NAD(P)-dependent dehydrogenase (short-subunit alcohol dehydrogenase family)